jgi:hypothetical protein
VTSSSEVQIPSFLGQVQYFCKVHRWHEVTLPASAASNIASLALLAYAVQVAARARRYQ